MNKQTIGVWFCALSMLAITMLISTAFAYTDREYQIYREMIDMPMSIPESDALKRIGKKYGKSPEEIKAIVEKVMREIHFGGSSVNETRKQKIQELVGRIATVKSVLVSSDFVNLAYVHTGTGWNADEVKQKILEEMPKILKVVFSVSGIERARLTAYFPAVGGGVKKVATLEADRTDFSPEKPASAYDLFLSGGVR